MLVWEAEDEIRKQKIAEQRQAERELTENIKQN